MNPDHIFEQFGDAEPFLSHRRDNRNAQHFGKRLMVERTAAPFKLVIHIERHNHRLFQFNKFGGKVKVPFQGRRRHHVDNDVGFLFENKTPHVQLLGRISRQRIGSRKISQYKLITVVP
ncbi:hypothetical protein SDC9_108527 [bioreactor metagenome]|uniref:Uncharacterized protein n=1 Tax=bioreactor metagenome TaxID=1076179 RepID=A0A645B8E2_9ZZZZ